jgi:hypothetical protein
MLRPRELRSLIGRPHSERLHAESGEEFLIEVVVTVADSPAGGFRISATADSPSTFRLERLEESILVAGESA